MTTVVTLAILIVLLAAACFGLAVQTIRLRTERRGLTREVDHERRAAETSERRIAEILGHVPMGIAAVEGGTNVLLYANACAKRLLAGRTPAALPVEDEDGRPLSGGSNPFTGMAAPVDAVPACLPDPAGRRHLSVGSVAVGNPEGGTDIVYIMRDETDRVLAERALERGHRLEALGTLTRGVAHDFNNMLTPILGGLDMVRRDQGLSASSARAVQRALQASSRAGTLVNRLLAFAREQTLEPRSVALGEIVETAVDLFGRKLGPEIEVTVTTRANPWVVIDPNQAELAILNLMLNARDAMPGGGTLRFVIDEEDAGPGAEGARRTAWLSVTDDGLGMEEEVRARAVEPFFTTKAAGAGAGLGLSMVDGLAAQSGGTLGIESAPGMGTRVDLRLPATTPGRDDAEADDYQPRRQARLLLVDDEETVREATADMLTALGHDVVQASSGAEAVAIVRRDGGFDGIVADQVMPGMTGGTMTHEIRNFSPDMPVLLISGHVVRGLPDGLPHLAKPFRRARLARAVDEMLDAAA